MRLFGTVALSSLFIFVISIIIGLMVISILEVAGIPEETIKSLQWYNVIGIPPVTIIFNAILYVTYMIFDGTMKDIWGVDKSL